MTIEAWFAVGGIIVTILVQTAVMFRWSGRLQQIVETDHEEINKVPGGLRDSRHQHAQLLTEHGIRLDEIEQRRHK